MSQSLCSYITYLAKSGLAYSSIKISLSAVRHFQISHGLAAPDLVAMHKLSWVERRIRRAKSTEQERILLPIMPTILRQLRALWSMNATSIDYIMLWAACCVAFLASSGWGRLQHHQYGAMTVRSYDSMQQLTIADMAVDDGHNPTMVRIHL